MLGVRERNVRVVYLRPWDHQDGDLSIEATNVEMVKEIASAARGRAATAWAARRRSRSIAGTTACSSALAALAVPSIFVLLLEVLRMVPAPVGVAAYALTVLLYAAGVRLASRHLRALGHRARCGALLFATAAFAGADARISRGARAATGSAAAARSLGWTLLATGVALLGALVVVGVMSSPLAMEEIERFRGVKLVLALPPLVALLLYVFDRRFGSGVERPRDVLLSPVLAYQLSRESSSSRRGAAARAQRQRERRLAVAVRAGAAPRADARAERASALQGVSRSAFRA